MKLVTEKKIIKREKHFIIKAKVREIPSDIFNFSILSWGKFHAIYIFINKYKAKHENISNRISKKLLLQNTYKVNKL